MRVTLDMLADALSDHAIRVGSTELWLDCWQIGCDHPDTRSMTLCVLTPNDLDQRGALPSMVIPAVACSSPEACHAVAERLGIDALASPLDPISLANALHEAWSHLDAWDLRLLEAIAARKTERQVLDIGVEALSNPVALSDSSAALVCHAGEVPESGGKSIWKTILERGFAPSSFYTNDEVRMLGDAINAASSNPLRFTPKRDQQHEYLVAPLMVDGRLVGTLSQVSISSPFTQGQIDLLVHLRNRMQRMLQTGLDVGIGKESGQERCLRLIVRRKHIETSVVAYYLRERRWTMDRGFRILVMPLPEGQADDVPASNYLMRVRRALPCSLAILEKGSVVAAFPEHDLSRDDIEQALRELTGEYPQAYGLSCAFRSFMDLAVAYQQALIACKEGARRQCCDVVDFGDCAFPHLAQVVAERAENEVLVHPRVRELLEEQGSRGPETLRLLESYLICGCNASKAGKRLYLHRSTLLYQIGKVEDAMGLVLDELSMSQQEHLLLSCMLLLARLDARPKQ